jgi:CRP/FNR family transcriptional regulator, cyclic AMP receptor protein
MSIKTEEFIARFAGLVRGMSHGEVDALVAALEHVRLRAGEILLTYGRPSDTLYLVWEGKLAITLDVDGETVALGEASSGQWVGDVTAIDPGPASAAVAAVQDCTLLTFSHEAFERFGEKQPRAASALHRILSDGLANRIRSSSASMIAYDDEGKLILERPPENEKHRLRRLLGGLLRASEGRMSLKELLRKTPALQGLGEVELSALEYAIHVENYPDGHVFIKEGEAPGSIFFIIEGEVRVTTRLYGQSRVHVDHTMRPGEIFGMISLLERVRHTATCTAAGPVVVGSLPASAFTFLYTMHASIGYCFQRLVAVQLARVARKLNSEILQALQDIRTGNIRVTAPPGE